MIRDSFITWSWILWSSGSSPHAFGRTKTSIRKIRPVRVCWLTLNVFSCSLDNLISAGTASWRCSRPPMEASHAFTPTCEWRHCWYCHDITITGGFFIICVCVCVCVSGLLNHGTRTPSPWTQTSSVAVWTTKATSSERQHEPVSPINYKH